MADKRSRPTRHALLAIVIFGLSVAAGIVSVSTAAFRGDRDSSVSQVKQGRDKPISSVFIPEGSREGLRISDLCFWHNELFVSYRESDRIEVYDAALRLLRRFALRDGAHASITAVAADADALYATDFASDEILFVNPRTGNVKQVFGFLPDGVTRIHPYAVTIHGDMLYVTDVVLHAVLAISAKELPALRELGEVVLRIPQRANDRALRFPTFTHVTADGRLLICDLAAGHIGVYSCSGRFIENFSVPGERMAPMGIGQDTFKIPAFQMRKDSIFDPSGTLDQGRIHVVDASTGCIRVFDPYGVYQGAYAHELVSPSGLAMDAKHERVFVADPGLGGIAVFSITSPPTGGMP
ncbi:MAG: hypothetical protein IH600_09515 [Bacteroidetes bacterium]|nr:hypothetical protein [Bacteroidota bacterium]